MVTAGNPSSNVFFTLRGIVYRCRVCSSDGITKLLDCGKQPLCNRFVTDPTDAEYVHHLQMGQCERCGLIQLLDTVPAEEMAPRFEWLQYNEPEGHLDALADTLCSLPGVNEHSIAAGISYKDDTLLGRLVQRGFSRAWRIDPVNDMHIDIPGAGGESVLPLLTPGSAGALVDRHGRADVVIARHVYEHAPDVYTLLDALNTIVAPNGYVVFEVPDCTPALEGNDYSMPWEEHTLYFTPPTLRYSFNHTDFFLYDFRSYPYPTENAMVAIIQPTKDSPRTEIPTNILDGELKRGSRYGEGIGNHADRLINYLNTYRQDTGTVAVFGAGHVSCMYINLMGIKDHIEFVADDDPNKKRLFMPGSKLPIRGSHRLIEDGIRLCMLTLSPESEAKVLKKQAHFIKTDGSFVSIFPGSPNRLIL